MKYLSVIVAAGLLFTGHWVSSIVWCIIAWHYNTKVS
jgi:hypothetical protein